MKRGREPRRIGDAWELRAAEYLESQGLKIIARGYRCRLGELDIVGSEGSGLVVVEVRARRGAGHGSAIETVDRVKQSKILRATRHFLMRNPSWHARPIRFDVLAIDAIDAPMPRITWVRNAFTAD